MISLIQSGFFEDFGEYAAWLWGVLFVCGGLLCLLIRKKSTRLITVCTSLALLGVLDLMVLFPTPPPLSGDGYAILGDIGLIGASFLAPFAAGICCCLLIMAIIRVLYRHVQSH